VARLFAWIRKPRFASFLDRFRRDRRGNVAMIFGITAIPLLFAVAMGIDYANNARRWSQMNAAADAAALAAVSPQMMLQSDAAAKIAATDMFNAQVSGFSGITATNLNIVIADSGVNRTATVSYTAEGANVFSGILNSKWMSLIGSSQASGQNPNMNFYLLLDTSPSMAIPATQEGITQMEQATTPGQCSDLDPSCPTAAQGCAFACHESNPPVCNYPLAPPNLPVGTPLGFDVCGNKRGAKGTPYYSIDGTVNTPATGIDNYQVARDLGITLRIDEVGNAAPAMVNTAIQTARQNIMSYGWSPTYQIQVNSFDTNIHTLFPLPNVQNYQDGLQALESLFSSLSVSPSPIQMLEVYSEEFQCGVTCATHVYNNDTDTNIDAALSAFNTPGNANYIPTPGTGSAPPATLIIVTDGLEDECVSSDTAGATLSTASTNPLSYYPYGAPCGPNRQVAPIAATGTHGIVPSNADCQAIKSRGIQIAILYTTYYPLDYGAISPPTYYDSNLYRFQTGGVDQIGQDLMNNCASPGLFLTVQVGENISTALSNLFEMILQTKTRLTQ
jgi:Flp pilus assembly protein TadG